MRQGVDIPEGKRYNGINRSIPRKGSDSMTHNVFYHHEHSHSHEHSHDGVTHTHEHVHSHHHEGEEHSHSHAHLHDHDHAHDHSHGCDHACGSCGGCDPMHETLALMQYMVNHNAAHARELADLAKKLEELGNTAAAQQVLAAVSEFEKGNLRLSVVLASLK